MVSSQSSIFHSAMTELGGSLIWLVGFGLIGVYLLRRAGLLLKWADSSWPAVEQPTV